MSTHSDLVTIKKLNLKGIMSGKIYCLLCRAMHRKECRIMVKAPDIYHCFITVDLVTL